MGVQSIIYWVSFSGEFYNLSLLLHFTYPFLFFILLECPFFPFVHANYFIWTQFLVLTDYKKLGWNGINFLFAVVEKII